MERLAVYILLLADVCHGLQLSLPGGAGVSFQNGILRIQTASDSVNHTFTIPPPETPALSSIKVKDTGTIKGFGAFATTPLKKGTFLGFYEGKVVKTREALDRILADREEKLRSVTPKPTNAMDYVMSLDGGMTFLDGYERAMDRSTFSPVHLNHADKGTMECNCVRLLDAVKMKDGVEGAPFCVAFFTSRDVLAEEELCFNYGSNFWKGREDQKLKRL